MRGEVQPTSMRTPAAIAYGLGLMGLGVLSLVFRDVSLQWEPVPAGIPARETLGVVSGLILLAAGLLTLPGRTRPWGALIAAIFIGLWVLGLHLPRGLAKPTNLPAWLGLAESLGMSLGAFILFRETRAGAEPLDRWPRIAVRLFGVSCVVFGASHFLFATFTAAMAPSWLPMRLGLVYLTGAIHAACGLLLLTGLWRRWAGLIEAAMMSSFVLLVHIPRVAHQPSSRLELTALAIAVILTSAAWLVATSRALGPRTKG